MRQLLDPRSILQHPYIYTTYQRIVGGYRARRLFIERSVKVFAGQKILDIGCGPGDILDFLPNVDYTGIDADHDYITKANEKYRHRGTFFCATVDTYKLETTYNYDLVIAAGVLHHLNDAEVLNLLELASKALKPNGRFVSMDGCFIPNQNKISKYFLKKDRGQFVRTQPEYEKLAKQVFKNVNASIEESFFTIPYTLIILDCNQL